MTQNKISNMILVDIETGGFEVESGIYEIGLLVIENNDIIEHLHLGIVNNPDLIHYGMGCGYEECSYNEIFITNFKKLINKYNYPLVAHNGSFDRKFLVHYGWIDESYPFYDSMRAIRYEEPRLFSYSMEHLIDFLNIDTKQTHTAMDDVNLLWEVLKYFKPKTWIPIGVKAKSKSNYNKAYSLPSLKENFEIVKDIFNNKTIVFTGKGPFKRNDLIQLAKKCGAIAENSVTKRTDILVVGEDSGSKLDKAKKLGIEIMNMSDFFELVSDIPLDSNSDNHIKQTINNESKECAIKILSDKFKGQTISLYPMRQALSLKVGKLVEAHQGTPLYSLRKNETNLLVYELYAEDFATVERAKKYNIKTMTLGEFNKLLINLEEDL